jgi:hypothetical protein
LPQYVPSPGLPDFCLVQKIGKNGAKWPQKYQIAIEYTKIAIKYTKIFHPEAFHNIQKWTFLVLKYTIWQP